MAIVSVGLGDTFDEWRVKTNTVATGQGDLTTLSTTHKASVVGAINELFTSDSDDMENLVDDTSPQLGGQLDLNNNNCPIEFVFIFHFNNSFYVINYFYI